MWRGERGFLPPLLVFARNKFPVALWPVHHMCVVPGVRQGLNEDVRLQHTNISDSDIFFCAAQP